MPTDDKSRVIQILKSHGIEMKVGGCGCCGSPWVTFRYLGETIVDDVNIFSFDTDSYVPPESSGTDNG